MNSTILCTIIMKILLKMHLVSAVNNYSLSIIHFSDFHARYTPIDNFSAACQGKNCIGGFSRMYTAIMQLKKENPTSILLNAGDTFQGTLWYVVHKWNVSQHFLNKLPLDAITLGNHEFDDGIDGLVPFLTHIASPVIVSNIDTKLEPRLSHLYSKSIIIENNGKKIGIIGALTVNTQETSHTGNIFFYDESASVNEEAKKLEKNVFTIVVLSHSGYETDIKIAQNSSSKISIIVGGHTDTFLYSTTPIPGPDKPSGPYPTVVLNKNGKKVLIIHASAYTKYLGNFTAFYDDYGSVVRWNGAPIFLQNEIAMDKTMELELIAWKKAVDSEGNKIVGTTIYAMKRKPCRSEECLLGNFATDAMVFHYNGKTSCENECWDNVSIGLIHGGGIRAGIEKGNITFNQLVTVFPFQDAINVGKIKGAHLKEILETFIVNNRLKFPHILQVSGLRVVFNTSNIEGQRVQSLEVCCRKLGKTYYRDINYEIYYQVYLPTFLSDSNFNPLFKKYLKNKTIGTRDSDIYVKYLNVKSPLSQKLEGRITIVS